MSQPLQIHTIVSEPFLQNTYIAWRADRQDALVIDPGLEPEPILAFLTERSLRPAAILNTHGHADHIAGNEVVKHAYPEAPLIIGERDAPLLTDPMLNMSGPFGFSITSPPADRLVREGDLVELAGLRLEVLDLPGHSPGHVVFVLREAPILVFGGDVLFRGSIGRTDFPGGNLAQLESGIRSKLYILPDETVIYPGHGPTTQVGHEKRTNAFVKPD